MTSSTPSELPSAARPDPERSVFINCPFDEAYEPLFDAIVFAVIASGYTPRSALETGDVSVPRMKQIVAALNASRYSIHDLSRCKGEGDENLARFNMPLELGMAFGKNHIDEVDRRIHDWLVLMPEGHFYRRCISDLSAYELRVHAGTVKSVMQPVMAWLRTRRNPPPNPGVSRALIAFPAFEARMKAEREEWGRYVPWENITEAAWRAAESAEFVGAQPRG
jgi:hypothetical protein